MTHKITIDKEKLAVWLLCFFRYSLRRHTYIVGDCCEDLIRYWDVMPEFYKKQIIDDLENYMMDLKGQHDCDVKDWRNLLDFAKKNK